MICGTYSFVIQFLFGTNLLSEWIISRGWEICIYICACLCVHWSVQKPGYLSEVISYGLDGTCSILGKGMTIFETAPRQSNVHYPTPKTLTEDFFICQLNPVHILSHCFFGIDFNIIIKFMYSSPKSPVGFKIENFYIFFHARKCCIPRQSHSL